MNGYDEDTIRNAHKASSLHRKMVEASSVCGCFYCLATFPPTRVAEWIDGGETARCPSCGIDSVLPAESGWPVADAAFLREMHAYWFSVSVP